MTLEQMCTAIAAAGQDAMAAGDRRDLFERAIKELRLIRANAIKKGIYFKQNPIAKRKAKKMRHRAERRLRQLLDAMKDAGFLTDGRATPGYKAGTFPTNVLTLDQLEIGKDEAKAWLAFTRMSDEEFEIWLDKPRKKPTARRSSPAGSSRHSATMPIADIKVGTRHRKYMGDIAGLARSITDVGLLHPIVVRPDGTLIAGERRLAAFKQLDRTEIPVTVVDLAEIVRGELAENAERKDFLPSEIEAIRRAMEPIEKAAAKARMAAGGGDHRSADQVGKVSTPDAGKTRDKIGAFAGVSGRTLEKIAAVVAAADAEPEKFGHLVEEMDRTGKVDRAHRQLKAGRQSEADAARAELSGASQTSAASSTERMRPAVNHAVDFAKPGSPAPVPEPAAAPENRDPVSSNNATQDVAPAPKTDAAPPTAPDQPAPTYDPWAHQCAAFYGFILELKNVDLGQMFASMPVEELQDAKDVVFALSAALVAAIERATPPERQMSPAA